MFLVLEPRRTEIASVLRCLRNVYHVYPKTRGDLILSKRRWTAMAVGSRGNAASGRPSGSSMQSSPSAKTEVETSRDRTKRSAQRVAALLLRPSTLLLIRDRGKSRPFPAQTRPAVRRTRIPPPTNAAGVIWHVERVAIEGERRDCQRRLFITRD